MKRWKGKEDRKVFIILNLGYCKALNKISCIVDGPQSTICTFANCKSFPFIPATRNEKS